jgi:hypothetical protein
MGKGLLIAIAGPFPLHYPVCVLPAYLHGPIGAEGIHHNNLIAPAQAIETVGNIPLFVEANDNGGHRRRRTRFAFLSIHAARR